MNSAIENPTRNANALTVRLLLPLSRIRKMSAEPRLASIRMKAMATTIFMCDRGSGASRDSGPDAASMNKKIL